MALPRLIEGVPAYVVPAAVVVGLWVLWPTIRGARTLSQGAGDVLAVPGRLASGAVDLGGQAFDLVGDVLGGIGDALGGVASAVANPVRTLGGDVPGSGNVLSRWVDRNIVANLPEAGAGDSLGTYLYNVFNREYAQ